MSKILIFKCLLFLLLATFLSGCQGKQTEASKLDLIKQTITQRCQAAIQGNYQKYKQTTDPKAEVIQPLASKQMFEKQLKEYKKITDVSKFHCNVLKQTNIPKGLLSFLKEKGFNPKNLQAVLVEIPMQETINNKKKFNNEDSIFVLRKSKDQWRLLISIPKWLEDTSSSGFDQMFN